MRWDKVVSALVSLWEADTNVTTALGGTGHIYPAQSTRPVLIPSAEWLMVPPLDYVEVWEIARIQVDYWARGWSSAWGIERHLTKVAHRDVSRTLDVGGVQVPVWILLIDGRTHPWTKADDPNVVHRSLDFEIRTVREKYVTAA